VKSKNNPTVRIDWIDLLIKMTLQSHLIYIFLDENKSVLALSRDLYVGDSVGEP
jgi:hypothetical protein